MKDNPEKETQTDDAASVGCNDLLGLSQDVFKSICFGDIPKTKISFSRAVMMAYICGQTSLGNDTAEAAISAISEWYDGEQFSIKGLVDEPKVDKHQDFEQSDHFLKVDGWQGGDESGMGAGHHGEIYFQLHSGKWIKTEFY